MSMIKSYTDVEQSKKLAEILPLESADMVLLHEEPYETSDSKFDGLHQALCVPFIKYDKSWRQKYKNISYYPCWSLAALLGVIPKHIKDYNVLRIDIAEDDFAMWYDEIGYGVNNDLPDITMKSAVDACVAMIERLHELKML
jgi:hypothetical protein